MRWRTGRATLAAVAAVVVAAGCAGTRIEEGVFHSGSGYRIVLPGPAWTVTERGSAELELRHRRVAAGMLVNAACDRGAARRSLDVLTRQLLVGLRDRTVLESGQVSLNGRRAAHAVVEGRPRGADEARVRVEAYVLKDGRCVYDLLYVAPSEAFDALRAEFEGFVQSFRTE